MRRMFDQILKSIAEIDNYIKVLVLTQYGNTLIQHEKYKHEGEDCLVKANELNTYPYWSERALSLFIP